MIRFGAMNFPVSPILDEIEAIAAAGMDYLELAMDPPQAHFSRVSADRRNIRKALERYKLGLVCHLPTFVQTADLAEGIRQASIAETLGALETAAELAAETVVLHPSFLSGMAVHVADQAHALAMDSLERFVARARQLGLVMGIENMIPGTSLFVEPEAFQTLFTAFASLHLVLDIGHAFIGDRSGARITAFIDRFEERLIHVHASDNHGGMDEHLCIGYGHINFKPVMQRLSRIGYDRTITLEVFDSDRSTLARSRQRLAQWL
jgi:sugar phosphate isomerase/epimerase